MKTNIDIIRKEDLNLTVIIVSGILSKEKMLDSLADYYADRPTELVLCDLTKATWSNMESGHVLSAINMALEHARAGKGGKTAVVVSSEHDFDITQMFAKTASESEYGREIMAFKSIPDACDWLDISEF